eukprot:14043547-Ditylum_brightwellii.AAC.3
MKVHVDLPGKFDGVAVPPVASHLFDTHEGREKLNKEDAQLFYCNVVELIFSAKEQGWTSKYILPS